ncbi:MAG: ClpX C4-type zinc finger protein [Acidimicrobiales bacterium]
MQAACSFCLKSRDDVGTLVAGPGVFICNECVTLSSQLIREKPAVVSQLAPWELAATMDEALFSLPRVAAAGAQAQDNLANWVLRARALGATWALIGEALGTTRQSAWERFSGEE